MTTGEVSLTVNGSARSAPAEARTLLGDFLRHGLGLTGTHIGCGQGVCGSCTVLLDGVPVRSCAVLAVQAEGARVDTVEGLADGTVLSSLQQAMVEEHGLQCGFCTPGMLMSLSHARRNGLSAAEATDQVLVGHLCRCTGYAGIRAAIERHWGEQEPPR